MVEGNAGFGNGIPAVPVQKVQTKYTTAMAVQRPRVLATVEKKSLEEAALLGADAFYAWGQGKDRIEGPTVELAMALVRCYGNCAVDLGEVQDTAEAWIFTATFVDLETGFTLSRQFRQSKRWVVHGRFDEARKDDIRFQIGQSKAVRNVVLNAVPAWLCNRAMDKAKGGVREAIENAVAKHGLAKVISVALEKLKGHGVDEARVLNTMGRQLPGAITVEDLVILHGSIAALDSGADTIDVLFPVTAEAGAAPEGGSRAEQVLGDLKGKTEEGPAPTPIAAEVVNKVEELRAKAAEAAGEPKTASSGAPAGSVFGQQIADEMEKGKGKKK